MTPQELEAYLYRHIPISAAMGVRVLLTEGEVRLRAPLEPNVNHRGTGFGGSLAAVATLAAWSALRVRLGDSARLVVVRQTTEYLRPVEGEFEGFAQLPEGAALDAFLAAYGRRGRARIEVDATIVSAGATALTQRGTFAALSDAP
ncbi:MAG: YiiD C-terminal domain-containing protein [Fimbriimonas sp.]